MAIVRTGRGARGGLSKCRGNVAEGDAALDVFAGKDGLVVPANKDTNVAQRFGRHVGVWQ